MTDKESNKNKFVKWLIAAGATLAIFARQNITLGVKQVFLSGIATTDVIPLKVVVLLSNNTIVRFLIRSIHIQIVSNGIVVTEISQTINRRIPSMATVQQTLSCNVYNREVINAILANVQSGDINNLSFELVGDVVIGEQWPISVGFSSLFTWDDIKTMI